MKVRLNGWMRLYLVAILFVLVPLAVWEAMNTYPERISKSELNIFMSGDVQQYLASRKSDSHDLNPLTYDFSASLLGGAVDKCIDHPYGGAFYCFPLRTNILDSERKAFEESVTEFLVFDHLKKVGKGLCWIVLKYLALALSILLFGHAVRWVSEGFKNS